jgi:hypothetical protein
MSCNSECQYEKIIFNNSEWKKATCDSYVDKDVDDGDHVEGKHEGKDHDDGHSYVDSDFDSYVVEHDVVEHDVGHPIFFTNYHHCQICDKTRSDNFIILNCNHTFHINCLANFRGRGCAYCHHPIDELDFKYLHNKFCNNAEHNIINMNEMISNLKAKIKKLQDSIIETERQYKRSQAILGVE